MGIPLRSPVPDGRLNPFIGPRPFQTGEKIYGRERESLTLLNLLIAERIVLFHSPSGAGKTSLIQAALIPMLQTRRFRLLPVIRVNLLPPPEALGTASSQGETTNRYVYSALSSLEKARPEEQRLPPAHLAALRLPEYLEQLQDSQPQITEAGLKPTAAQPADLHRSNLYIFDQFEEILTLDPVDQLAKQAFFEQLGQLLADRDIFALFAIREDYLAALDPFLLYIPTRFKTTFRLDLLNPLAARQAVQKTAADGGVEFSDPAADKLIDDLRTVKVQQLDGSLVEQPGPYIEPMQLQVVCRRLWEGLPSEARQITQADITSAGDVDQSLAAYYAEQVASIASQVNVPERLVRDWFQHKLVTEQGVRGMVLKGVEASEGLDNRAILLLENAHLVRSEKRTGSTWYELAHDRLVAPVRQNNETWFQTNLSLLQRQAELWEREKRPDHLLLRDQTLKEAQTWATAHSGELTNSERDFLQASLDNQAQAEQQQRLETERQRAEERAQAERQRAEEREQAAARLRQRLALALIAGAIALIFFVIAAVFWNSANQQRQAAETARAVAAGNAEAAVVERDRANAEQARAQAAEAVAKENEKTAQADRDLKATAEAQALAAKGVAESLAATAQAEATAQVPIAGSRLLAAQALSFLDSRPDLSALLGIEAYRIRPTWEALNLLLLRILREPGLVVRSYGGSLPDQPYGVNSLAISPDGKNLAWGRNDGSILIREIDSGITTLHTRHTQQVSSVAFSPDGAILASGSYDKRILLWDVSKLADQNYRPVQLIGDPETLVLSLSYSPDGEYLAAGVGQFVLIFDLQSNTQIHRMQHTDYVYSLAWSPNGKWLAAGDADGNLIVWDPTSEQRYKTPGGVRLKGVVYSLAWSPDSQLLAAGDQAGKVILYDIQRGESIGEPFEDHTKGVLSLSFSRDGRILASGAADNQLFFWDVPTRRKAGAENLGYWVNALDFTRAEGPNLLAAAGYDFRSGRLNILEVLPADPLYELQEADPGKVFALAVDPAGKLLSARPSSLNMLEGGDEGLTSAAFGSGGEAPLLAVGDEQGRIRLFDWNTRQPIGQFELPKRVEALAISSGDAFLAASYCEESAVEVRPVCLKNIIHVWDLTTRQTLTSTLSESRHDWIRSLTFQPNSKLLVSGSYDGSLLVWDFLSGSLKAESNTRYPGGITSLAFNPDGRLLASGGTSGKLLLWDTAAGFQPIGQALEGAGTSILALAFDLPGKWLYSGEESGFVLKWNTNVQAWIERNCALAGRNLTSEEVRQYLPDKGSGYQTCPQYP